MVSNFEGTLAGSPLTGRGIRVLMEAPPPRGASDKKPGVNYG